MECSLKKTYTRKSKKSLKAKSKVRAAVLCSGFGSNLQALLDAEKKRLLKAEISLVLSDKPNAYALVRANRAKKMAVLLEAKGFASREDYDQAVLKILKKSGIDLVILAGFMRILSESFVNALPGRILNVHPALLPSFKGTHAIRDAYDHGARMTGVTVHFVTPVLDDGPIILQEAVRIEVKDTEKTLAQKIHKIEHKLYPKAVRLFAEGKLKIKGRKVHVRH